MLSKKNRLNKKDFQNIIKNGKFFSTSVFKIYFIKDTKQQFAVITPKKFFKKAVTRNKFRRVGYNIIRNVDKKNLSGIFFYKKTVNDNDVEHIRDDIIFAFKNIK